MKLVHASSKGLKRKINKDFLRTIDSTNYLLVLLFDGVSSSLNATKAIKIFDEFILNNHQNFQLNKKGQLQSLMIGAQQYLINSEVIDGYSTCAIVFIDKLVPENNKYISLGDTRIYTIDPQYLKQVNTDDNPLNTPNVVTRFIGMLQFTSKDFAEEALPLFQRLLICTDGFYNLLDEDLIKFHRILNFKNLGSSKRSLSKAIHNKNVDDASYIILEQYVQNRERLSNRNN